MRKVLLLVLALMVSTLGNATPKYKSIEKLVATAGTRVALSSTKLMSSHVLIKARPNNSGIVYVGGSDVAAANGYHLAANAEVKLSDLIAPNSNELLNLADVYIDAATNGDGVRVLYVYDRYKP